MSKIRTGIHIIILIVCVVLIFAGSAPAVSYYEAGSESFTSGNASMNMGNIGGTRTLSFYNNAQMVLGPTSDTNLVNSGLYQYISGTYNLTWVSGEDRTKAIYALTLRSGANSTVTVGPDPFSPELTATTKALTINFATNTISWDTVTMGTIANTVDSSSLAEMQAVKDTAGGIFQFSKFIFQHTEAVDAWLTSGTANQTYYYSKLEGIAPAPEPAEWMLILIGLGLTGFYLHRRGMLITAPISRTAV